MNQVWSGASAFSAVPVLPATWTPSICARRPVPLLDDAGHHLGELVGDVGGDRLAQLLRVGLVDDGEVGRLHLVDQVGLHQACRRWRRRRRSSRPAAASAGRPAGRSSCAERGVVLDVPELARRDRAAGSRSPRRRCRTPRPCRGRLSSPRSMPSWAKAVLQEMVSASISGWSAPPLQLSPLKFSSVGAGAGQREHVGRRDHGVRRVARSASAAADTMTLKIEPGG